MMASASFFDHFGLVGRVGIGKNDMGASFGKAFANGPTDASTTSCNQRDSVGERSICISHFCLPPVRLLMRESSRGLVTSVLC